MTDTIVISDRAAQRAQEAYISERRNWQVHQMCGKGWTASRAGRYEYDDIECKSFNAAHEVMELACWKVALAAAR